MILRLAVVVIAVLALYSASALGWHAFTRNAHDPRGARPQIALSEPTPTPAPKSAAPVPQNLAVSGPQAAPLCTPAPSFAVAATQNAASLAMAEWSAFGRPETGWEIYAPLVKHELATSCPPAVPGFAQALASWQSQHNLPATGVMDEATLKSLNVLWLRRRPFVEAAAHGACPPPPPAFRLAFATPAEGYQTKPIQLRTTALDAYRRMAAAARQALPSLADDKQLLTIFSGFRDPAEEAARCATGGCGTVAKANCSAHRTGLALDLYLGAAPGSPPESSTDDNRLFQSHSAVYRWLVANAARFGFVPYPFEPWHWEWTGEAP